MQHVMNLATSAGSVCALSGSWSAWSPFDRGQQRQNSVFAAILMAIVSAVVVACLPSPASADTLAAQAPPAVARGAA